MLSRETADPPSLVAEVAQLADGLVVPLCQFGIRLLQFIKEQGTDGIKRVVRLRGSVSQGQCHSLAKLVA